MAVIGICVFLSQRPQTNTLRCPVVAVTGLEAHVLLLFITEPADEFILDTLYAKIFFFTESSTRMGTGDGKEEC